MTDTRVGPVSSYWWVFLLRGIVGILFGVYVVMAPGSGLAILIALFGFYAIFDGVMAIVHGFRFNKLTILVGVVGVLAGIVAFARPMVAGYALLIMFAGWIIIMGAASIYEAFAGEERTGLKWLFAIVGAIGVVLGIMMLTHPGWGLLTFVMFAGFYSLISGISFLVLGFRLRGYTRPPKLSPA